MNTHRLQLNFGLKILLAMVALAAGAFARDTARIVKIVGSGSATVDGQRLQPNMEIAMGKTILTGRGVKVFLETAEGALATIGESSELQIKALGQNANNEVTDLFLKEGSIISTIDPKKKDKIDYQVSTQRGVAAAKATVYTVTAAGTTVTVATLSGTVTITPPAGTGLGVLTINLGTGTVLSDAPGAAAVALSQIAQQNTQVAQAISNAVDAVATAIQTNAVSGLDAAGATAILTTVVGAASQALPQQAPAFTQQAVNAATSPGSTVSGGGSTNAVTQISEAAAQGATQTLTQQGNSTAAQQVNQQIAQTASNTASGNNVTVNPQAIVNSVQAGASSGASKAGAPPPPPPSLPGTTPPATTPPATVNPPATTPQINTDARNVSPSN